MTIDISNYKLQGSDKRLYILSSSLVGIQGAMQFMRKVIYGTELYSTTYKTSSGIYRTTVSSLGKHMQYINRYSDIFSNEFKFSPLLEFFFEEYRKHPIKDCIFFKTGNSSAEIDLFNDFVVTMRKEAIKTNLKKRVSDWESKPKKNMQRLMKFEAALFKRHARVMVVRLDLNYHQATFTIDEIDEIIASTERQKNEDQTSYLDGQDISTPRPIEGRIAFDVVQKDRKRLFTNMKSKPSLFKHLVGYVWRIECGRAAGYHLHVMLFFDGAYVQKHEYLAHEIGMYWQDTITEGRGYFENCNRKKEKYGDSWALGEIDHRDALKRENLNHAMQYFCKTNQMVQVIPYAGCHLFGSGFVHRQRKTKSGRPRTKGMHSLNYQPPLR